MSLRESQGLAYFHSNLCFFALFRKPQGRQSRNSGTHQKLSGAHPFVPALQRTCPMNLCFLVPREPYFFSGCPGILRGGRLKSCSCSQKSIFLCPLGTQPLAWFFQLF